MYVCMDGWIDGWTHTDICVYNYKGVIALSSQLHYVAVN